MRADGLRHRRKVLGTKRAGELTQLPLADGAVEGDTGHVPLKRLIKDARDPATFKGGWR